MIILGVILLVLGLILKLPVLWTIGIIVAVFGLALLVIGAAGRTIGGRRYWY